MSRRKQARPSKLIDDEDDQPALNLKVQPDANDGDDSAAEGGRSSDEGSGSDKQQEEVRRQRQDAENNNSVGGDEDPIPSVAGHVLLEALQNTKVAVAQIPAAPRDDEAAAPPFGELAALQSTLFTLQHQQMMQISLIQQLQSHLTVAPKEEGGEPPRPSSAGVPLPAALPTQHSPKPGRPASPELVASEPPTTPSSQTLPPSQKQHQPLTIPKPPLPMTIQSHHQHPSMCSISSSLASSIITNNDPPSLNEPNTLEMLQKRAQEVLDNASQGLLASNLADELAFRKNGKNSLSPLSGGRNEPFFKHRCRYCGKVFGSDSALQIHIRSHTGERPFKCNVCGSRFTTKGNLKVHFQRHSSKFPHIKMNPNPVPEHLDKFHPPLLAQIGNQGMSPGLPPHPGHPGHPGHQHTHHQFPGGQPFPPGLPMFRPPLPHDLLARPPAMLPTLRPHEATLLKPLLPMSLFVPKEEQEMPADLSKSQFRLSSKDLISSRSPSPVSVKNEPSETDSKLGEDRLHSEPLDNMDEGSPTIRLSDGVKTEPFETDRRSENNDRSSFDERSIGDRSDVRQETDNDEVKNHSERLDYSSHYDDCSVDSKYSDEEDMRDVDEQGDLDNRCGAGDQPENLTSKSPMARSESSVQRIPSMSFLRGSSPLSTTSSHEVDPAKDPAIYNCLLPRPGSNDNSWESLIEVTKTSETQRLQQLVDNIENKVTDPNQCVICHRILSCKSALQMHYRTHTGERPFRCKICGRAFTTKGNLKTHMGVHRLKPPMRMLHQCPVCHKKFTNSLVLQQHIRLHTGEPTDLTPEQIYAAEIKDYPSPGSFPPGSSPGFSGPFSGSRAGSEKDEDFDFDDYDDNMSNSSGSPHYSSFENQLRAVTNMASHLSAEDLTVTRSPPPGEMNGRPSPSYPQSHETSPPASPRPLSAATPPRPASPTPSESNSQGALDLTPKSSAGLVPGRSPGPSPGFFSGLGLLSPGGPSPLMTSALSSLTSSVITSTTFSPLGMAMGPGVRGNTTCNLCFKTFACHSALEIHYRSHTKERPFKCTICDRGFSTKGECGCRSQWRIKRFPEWGDVRLPMLMHPRRYATGWPTAGNMKQHMLTHKIRDMPPHLFDSKRPLSSEELTSDSNASGGRSTTPAPSAVTPGPPLAVEEPRAPLKPPSPIKMESPPPPPPPPPPVQFAAIKRSPPEGDLPVSKRPPAMPKHLCQVCNKNFSSSSALQIHMRTHTGDKPFRCTVCQKAFTTKGNLKVHMGTHMWSNGASRRGRRMSLDLPPIPFNPKDSEFLQRRPDLFYPYLPTPFLNGVHHKLNEMSALQMGHPGNGMHTPGKYSGLLGFGGFGSLDKGQDAAGSPPLALSMNSRRGSPPSRVADELPRGVWDMHFDRRNEHSDERMDVSSPNHLPPREGLAA